ncbi:MAG TPA: AMP-binding protein [Streptosporangiaceae bacterium]|nr:AMP-binding protein [Streptosporangiaceae bacterium]
MTAIEMPSADVTVTEHVLGIAPGRYGRSALVDPACRITISYSSLAAKVRAAAAGLARRGMRPGDVAGVYVTGPVAFALASQSIRAAGGVPAPASPGSCHDVIAAQLAECDARILITDGALAHSSLDIAERSRVRQVISFGEISGVTRFDALMRGGTMRPLHRGGEHVALLTWTPGRADNQLPRPVTHGELGAEVTRLAAEAKVAAWDVILAGPPSGDGRGYSALLDLALAVGATVVAAPSAKAEDLVALGRTHRATVAFVPPCSDLSGNSLRRVTITP